MRILVACEFSGRVRDAFIARGHDAWSCDIKPTEVPGPHLQKDFRWLIKSKNRWDMMIAFPPCQYLTRANAWRWNNIAEQRDEALEFVKTLMNADIPRIAIENPAGAIGSHIRKADQYIHPWMFGEPWQKQTGLWLKNLPKLVPTHQKTPDVQPFIDGHYPRQIYGITAYMAIAGQKRMSKDRGRTFQCVADAMAEQWGNLGP